MKTVSAQEYAQAVYHTKTRCVCHNAFKDLLITDLEVVSFKDQVEDVAILTSSIKEFV